MKQDTGVIGFREKSPRVFHRFTNMVAKEQARPGVSRLRPGANVAMGTRAPKNESKDTEGTLLTSLGLVKLYPVNVVNVMATCLGLRTLTGCLAVHFTPTFYSLNILLLEYFMPRIILVHMNNRSIQMPPQEAVTHDLQSGQQPVK